ncbi:unnamed protein product [Protopolystoma xenopodis]|uniref:Uncharacterized protein n=1 Tax=Protopolystoma xenopodis TaxID=117903 RepID=A0A448WDQ2_9PLAT|nr:unnamed protein product [Protopolystoma xenopodis]
MLLVPPHSGHIFSLSAHYVPKHGIAISSLTAPIRCFWSIAKPYVRVTSEIVVRQATCVTQPDLDQSSLALFLILGFTDCRGPVQTSVVPTRTP